ncbi:MAG: hypothetical protein L0170_18815, partial [Acidobacteria bacterium]|nr:hypothetical protein [Acidobacteriota bacterium]
ALLEWVNSHWFTVTLLWVISGVLSSIAIIRWMARTPEPTTMLRNSANWRDQIQVDKITRPMSFDEKEAVKELLAEDHDLLRERQEERLDSFDLADDFEFLNDDPYWPEDLPRPSAPDQVVNFDDPNWLEQIEQAVIKAEELRDPRQQALPNLSAPLQPQPRVPYQSLLVERTREHQRREHDGSLSQCDECSAGRVYTVTIYSPAKGLQDSVETFFFCPGDLRRKLRELAAEPITREEQTNFTDL